MVGIARKNLLADKVRLLISVSGITFAILLILVIQSLYQGFRKEAGSIIERMPGDVWVAQQGASDLYFSQSMLPRETVDEVHKVEGVQSAYPMLARRWALNLDGRETLAFLMALDTPAEVPPMATLRTAPGPGEIVIDTVLARKTGLGVGDTLRFDKMTFTISEVSNLGHNLYSQMALISWEDAHVLLGVEDRISYLLVSVDEPREAEEVARAITEGLPGVDAFTRQEFAAQNQASVDGFLPIISVLKVLAFVVGIAVVGLTIYAATVERIREYGVLKAIGASHLALFRIVMVQSLLVGLAGFLLGVPVAYGTTWLARHAVPEWSTLFRWQDVALVLAAALIMSAVAAYLPIQRVARVDPAIVFRA